MKLRRIKHQNIEILQHEKSLSRFQGIYNFVDQDFSKPFFYTIKVSSGTSKLTTQHLKTWKVFFLWVEILPNSF
jgi:hypothetical protein